MVTRRLYIILKVIVTFAENKKRLTIVGNNRPIDNPRSCCLPSTETMRRRSAAWSRNLFYRPSVAHGLLGQPLPPDMS